VSREFLGQRSKNASVRVHCGTSIYCQCQLADSISYLKL
jgi:hypothetical protein